MFLFMEGRIRVIGRFKNCVCLYYYEWSLKVGMYIFVFKLMGIKVSVILEVCKNLDEIFNLDN